MTGTVDIEALAGKIAELEREVAELAALEADDDVLDRLTRISDLAAAASEELDRAVQSES